MGIGGKGRQAGEEVVWELGMKGGVGVRREKGWWERGMGPTRGTEADVIKRLTLQSSDR